MLGLIAYNDRPDTSGNLLVRRCLVGHPAGLKVVRRDTGTHFVHSQRSRHQREYPPMVDRRENERGGQTFLAQCLHGVEDGAEL